MKNCPIISVIIPSFNEEKYLSSCLKSVLSQDFPKKDYEIIMVDNDSSDKTLKIAKSFKRVKVLKELKKGLVMARNKGLQKSRGKIIVNLDADCLVPINWLRKIKIHFEKNKKLVVLTGPYIPYKDEKNPVDYLNIKIVNFFYQNFNYLLSYWGGNTAILKKTLLKVGGYNLLNPYHDELQLLKKLRKKGQLVFDPSLKIISSNRRVKNRFLKFFLKEVVFLYLFNNLYNKITNKHWQAWEVVR